MKKITEAMSDIWPSYGAWADAFDVPESVPIEDAEPLEPDPEPSSGSRPTIPCPPPALDEAPPTSRCAMSAPVTDRPVVVDIVSR